MAGRRNQSRWGPTYRITVSFRAPLAFAFAWCTDYTPGDAKLEGDSYERKIIERSPRRVILEDLYDTKTGWIWSREVVTLQPPNRWHMDGVGNERDVTAEYVLTPLPDGGTQLELQWRRMPKVPAASKLTTAQREASALRAWKRFATSLERDYKRRARRR